MDRERPVGAKLGKTECTSESGRSKIARKGGLCSDEVSSVKNDVSGAR